MTPLLFTYLVGVAVSLLGCILSVYKHTKDGGTFELEDVPLLALFVVSSWVGAIFVWSCLYIQYKK